MSSNRFEASTVELLRSCPIDGPLQVVVINEDERFGTCKRPQDESSQPNGAFRVCSSECTEWPVMMAVCQLALVAFTSNRLLLQRFLTKHYSVTTFCVVFWACCCCNSQCTYFCQMKHRVNCKQTNKQSIISISMEQVWNNHQVIYMMIWSIHCRVVGIKKQHFKE